MVCLNAWSHDSSTVGSVEETRNVEEIPSDGESEAISAKMRSYLAELYQLTDISGNLSGYITTSALADAIGVSPPAINRMVNRLKELGLLEHEPYQGIRMTSEGRIEALKHLRHQRIAEVFMVDIMNIPWEEAALEAQAISPAITPALLDRMRAMTGDPKISPLGEPVPSEAGTLETVEDFSLAQASAGQHIVITRIRTQEADRLHYVRALGLLPGTALEIVHVAPFEGPLQLRLKSEYRIIGHNLAQLIRVRPA